MPKPRRITARATVNLHGLRAGETALVDPTDTRVAGLLRTGLLIDDDAQVEPIAETPAEDAESLQEKPQAQDDAEPGRKSRRPRAASTASDAPHE